MTIPTEPIGSLPRPLELIEALETRDGADPSLEPLYEAAIRDTIERFEMKPDQRVFVGVVAPIDPRVETPEEVRDRVLAAAEFIPVAQLGTTDDCGFSPFCDDTTTSRDTAFAKITARVKGTALASELLGAA